MFNRLKALVWLRNQTIIANKKFIGPNVDALWFVISL